MRYFIELSYEGTSFVGWQRQPKGESVQACLEDALCILFRESIAVVGAGRTDAGVHARQLFAHVDLPVKLPEDLIFRLNKLLPKSIAVLAFFPVLQESHARFDAISRSYTYIITTKKNPFLEKRAYQFTKNLNIDLMNEAAAILLTHKDFKCFSKSKTDVKTYICNVLKANWERKEHKLIFSIQANRFLRNMVRAVVGTLIEVGLEKVRIDDFKNILASRDRSQAGYSVPAHGLYLINVSYPKHIFAV